jgi:hypothetical protein
MPASRKRRQQISPKPPLSAPRHARSTLKQWPTFFLIIAGLSFVLYFQLAPGFQPVDAAAAAAHDPRPAPPPARKTEAPALTFGGYPCPGGCAEDKAGYAWAARNRIHDPDDCTGTTAPFIEGCRVYAEQQTARTAD